MDVLCTRCGEPWAVDHVLHGEPDGFEREGALIRSCPACRGKPKPELSPQRCSELEMVGCVAKLVGDDLDALASFVDDLALVK